jgi:16S rRNA (cytidine1402-2'-O)-methyltransferase
VPDPNHIPTTEPSTPSPGPAPDRQLAPGLYLVATPIGNLEDVTLRALRVLRSVDRVACEDTRQTAKLLGHFGIRTPTVSYHAHNEGTRASELIEALKAGARIAVVSDAGTPGIADPGSMIAAEAIAAGVPVFPIPGANAALSALIASGLPADRFTFHGFLPSKEGLRRTTLEVLRAAMMPTETTTTHIFYETPHRILEALADLEVLFGAGQHVVVARELTKLHEEFLRGTVSEIRATLAARAQVRGEIVLLFALAPEERGSQNQSIAAAVEALAKLEGIPEKDALKRIARERNISKSDAYRELQREQSRRKP